MANKYWIANNPNAEITNAQAVALASLSSTELDNLDDMVAELKTLTHSLPAAAEADVAAPSAYTAHAAGSTTVTSNAATDLDTTAAALATLVTEVTAIENKLNALLAKLRAAGILTA